MTDAPLAGSWTQLDPSDPLTLISWMSGHGPLNVWIGCVTGSLTHCGETFSVSRPSVSLFRLLSFYFPHSLEKGRDLVSSSATPVLHVAFLPNSHLHTHKVDFANMNHS